MKREAVLDVSSPAQRMLLVDDNGKVSIDWAIAETYAKAPLPRDWGPDDLPQALAILCVAVRDGRVSAFPAREAA